MRFSFSASCCLAVLSLGACTEYPNPMARGYVSYDQVYKSAPGPQVSSIGYEYSYGNNKAALKDIQYAARDLVEKLDKKLAMSIDEIYLKVHSEGAFYNSFDHALREEMTRRGYLLSKVPVNTLTLDFVVVEDIPECTGVLQQEDGAYKTLFLGLAINVTEGMPQDMVGDYYEVPIYDLGSGDNAGVNLSLCPEEEQIVDITQAMVQHEEEKQTEQIGLSDIAPELLEAGQSAMPEELPEE